MSLTTIMNKGVTGMTAQSAALNTISDNIANSTTTGYKASETEFSALVGQGGSFDGSGVRADVRLLADKSGTISQTGVTTNAAIVGQGFFAVATVDPTTGKASSVGTAASGAPELTRAGDFQQDRFGHLVNGSGRALMGFAVDPANPTASSSTRSAADLQLVSLDTAQSYFAATSQISLNATLPGGLAAAQTPSADNTVGVSIPVVDKTGAAGSVDLRFMKTASNADGTSVWTAYRAGATNGDGTVAGGASVSDPTSWQSLGTVSFAADGTLSGGTKGINATLALGAVGNLPAMTVDLGGYGSTGDAMNTTVGGAAVGTTISNVAVSNDGIPSGSLQSVDLTSDGFVRGTFDGGKTRDFFRVPDVTVVNATDLEAESGAAYQVTTDSGAITFRDFGTGQASGESLAVGSVEGSNVSIEAQFTTLITAQRAYSASSKIISTGDEMTQTVLGMLN
jgi:flagellar hook protein FlgE